jgi:amidophosphoribosyltransferase
VRGTTLEKSILTMLDRLEPKKIIIVSSAPQIRYPDCYGIDMSRMKDFIAFRAALELLKDTKQENILDDVYEQCQAYAANPEFANFVQKVYEPFSDEQISRKIAEIIKTEKIKAEVEVIYQNVENLHNAIPNHLGDWYFTGNYPTKGGNKVVNRAFMNFMEGKAVRAY